MIVLVLILNTMFAHASPIEVSRRGFMLGSASVAVMAKLPCSQIIAPLEEAPKALAARSTLFSEALRFWPKWASELDPSQPHFFPAYRLNVHDNPSFVALAREKRFSLVQEYLLKSEKTIEQKLSDLPFRVAVRTGMSIEKARNLGRLFLEDNMISNTSKYKWLRYHRAFFMTALDELERIEPNFGRMYRLAIEHYREGLDDENLPKKRLQINLEDGTDELYRIEARVMELTGDWKIVFNASHAIHRHWWFHIFPGYNRYGYLSDMTKSRVGLESLNRFLASDLPKLNLAQIKEPLNFVPDPTNPGWGKIPALDAFPVRQSIELIKVEARLLLEAKRLLLKPIQAELDELKALIEAPVRPDLSEPELQLEPKDQPKILTVDPQPE